MLSSGCHVGLLMNTLCVEVSIKRFGRVRRHTWRFQFDDAWLAPLVLAFFF